MKMREVVGAFGSLSRLSESLEELYSEGITPDFMSSYPVSIACRCGV